MTRALGVLVISTAAIVACDPSSKKSDDATKDAGSITHVTAAPLDAGFDAGRSGLSADQKQAFDAHMKEGHTTATWSAWGEAMHAFEAATAIDPDDARAESELGWAAFNAGDLAKAKTATDRAIAIARDPIVKAESLYNAGRIAEASQDRDSAKHDYEGSLALRPNDTVKRALSSLDTRARAPEIDMRLDTECVQAKDEAALCDCMVSERKRENAKYDAGGVGGATCTREDSPGLDEGLVILKMTTAHDVLHYVASKSETGAVLGALIGHGGPSGDESWKLGAIVPKTLAGKATSWIHASTHKHTEDSGPDERMTRDEELLVICVPGQSTRPCFYPIPLSTTYIVEREHPDKPLDPAVAPAATPDVPFHRTTTVDVRGAEDGQILCVLDKGRANDLGDDSVVLGTHRVLP